MIIRSTPPTGIRKLARIAVLTLGALTTLTTTVTAITATATAVASTVCPSSSISASGWTNLSDIHWTIRSEAITTINQYQNGSTTLTTNAFNNPRTNEMGPPPLLPCALPTKAYDSEQAFAAQFPTASPAPTATPTPPPGSPWVLYDNENWGCSINTINCPTPISEQQDPGKAMADFVTVAHQHGFHVIVTPSLDLVTLMLVNGKGCDTSTELWVNYLDNCQLPKLAAQAQPDAFEIQAQAYQSQTGPICVSICYPTLVEQAANQARTQMATLPVLAGLTTNHKGQAATADDLYTDSVNTKHSVVGYLLNVPQGLSPDVAVNYLKKMGYSDAVLTNP